MSNYVLEQPLCLTSHANLHFAIGYQPNRNLILSRGRHLVTFDRNASKSHTTPRTTYYYPTALVDPQRCPPRPRYKNAQVVRFVLL